MRGLQIATFSWDLLEVADHSRFVQTWGAAAGLGQGHSTEPGGHLPPNAISSLPGALSSVLCDILPAGRSLSEQVASAMAGLPGGREGGAGLYSIPVPKSLPPCSLPPGSSPSVNLGDYPAPFSVPLSQMGKPQPRQEKASPRASWLPAPGSSGPTLLP